MTDPLQKKYNVGDLLSALQFQQRNQEPVGLVQDSLLSREEDKRTNGFKTSQGIYAIGLAPRSGALASLSCAIGNVPLERSPHRAAFCG